MFVSPINFSHRQRSNYLQISWEFFAGPKRTLLVAGLKVELGENLTLKYFGFWQLKDS